MRHFHPPIPAAVVAVTLVAGLASYQGVDKLVLAKGGATYGTDSESGHDSSPGNGSGEHHGSTSTTIVHHEPTSSTIPTPPGDPGSTTSTTVHHETGSTTSTTVHKETPPPTTAPPTTNPPTNPPTGEPPTTAPPTTAPPTTTVQLLSFGCMNGITGDQGWTKCGWSRSKSPSFDHYVLTRELVGTPRQVIFVTSDVTNTYFVDGPLQAGAQYSYMIGAFDAAGNLIGQGGGPIHLTCCPGGIATP
jgi:hypothetical protein